MPGGLAFLFILGYIMAVSGFALLLRYSEGATLLAIVLVSVLHCPLSPSIQLQILQTDIHTFLKKLVERILI